jgi:hypothetical protein
MAAGLPGLDDLDLFSSPVVPCPYAMDDPAFDFDPISLPEYRFPDFEDFPLSHPCPLLSAAAPGAPHPFALAASPPMRAKRAPAIFRPFASFQNLDLTVKALEVTVRRRVERAARAAVTAAPTSA